MTYGIDRRRFLALSAGGVLAACGGGAGQSSGDEPAPPPDSQVDKALAALDDLANDLMRRTGVPGMAVAVVRGEQKVYAKGFGTRVVDTASPVDADTVFQLASVSKSIGASVVAKQVGFGRVQWETPVRRFLPWFTLDDLAVSDAVTIGDLYAHRSGLPFHAGDRLEDVGFDRRTILERLRYLPLQPFRKTYNYTNFGMTAGAEAVSAAVGMDWATLSEMTLYQPLGMMRTSSRYQDFENRSNRASNHVEENGKWRLSTLRRDADAQSPAGGVSSSVNDVAKWLSMMLGKGTYQGSRIVDQAALQAAVSPQMETPSGSHYGYGFNIATSPYGRKDYNHSGGFALGAATCFRVIPSTGVGIVALSNGWPIGVPEALGLSFFEIVQTGSLQRDWYSIVHPTFAESLKPEGSLVGVPRPTNPAPPSRPLAGFAGSYANAYHGPALITLESGALMLGIGSDRRPLEHWDGDLFTFTMYNENATPGTVSKASFAGNSVTLEWFDQDGVGTFVR